MTSTRTVIAMPGTFCSPLIFDRLRPLISDRFELVAPSWMTDAPAWSLEAVAAWVADRILAERRAPVLLLGHSTGGAITLRLALDRPELLRGLMLINTGPNMRQHGDVVDVIRRMEWDGTADVMPAVIDRSFHLAPSADDRRRLLDYGHKVSLRAALDVLRSQHATDFEPDLPSLRMPVSVVHGRFDRVRTIGEAKAMAAAVPDGRLLLVAAGHSPVYEVPEAVAAALDELDRRAG